VLGSETETEFVGGFLRSAEGALVATTEESPVYGVVPGFVTNAEGLLSLDVMLTTTWQEGFLRGSNGNLSITDVPV
jgi:hypothetical protein